MGLFMKGLLPIPVLFHALTMYDRAGWLFLEDDHLYYL